MPWERRNNSTLPCWSFFLFRNLLKVTKNTIWFCNLLGLNGRDKIFWKRNILKCMSFNRVAKTFAQEKVIINYPKHYLANNWILKEFRELLETSSAYRAASTIWLNQLSCNSIKTWATGHRKKRFEQMHARIRVWK